MYFHGIVLTLALKHGDRSKDRSKVFYSQKTGTAVLQFCRTIGCPNVNALSGATSRLLAARSEVTGEKVMTDRIRPTTLTATTQRGVFLSIFFLTRPNSPLVHLSLHGTKHGANLNPPFLAHPRVQVHNRRDLHIFQPFERFRTVTRTYGCIDAGRKQRHCMRAHLVITNSFFRGGTSISLLK